MKTEYNFISKAADTHQVIKCWPFFSLLFSSHVCDPIQGGLGFEGAEIKIGVFQHTIIEKANIQYFKKYLSKVGIMLFIESSTEASSAPFWSHNFKFKLVLPVTTFHCNVYQNVYSDFLAH